MAIHGYDARMTYSSQLRRTPFLTPIWLTVLGALLAFTGFAFALWVWGTADATTVVVIRHAERELTGDDPPLTPSGEARAELLSRMFGDGRVVGHIDGIYTLPTVRSRMTAAPLAARLGILPVVAQDEPSGLAHRIIRDHAGGRVLVVGRSDTVPEIVAALTHLSPVPKIAADEYGTMYIVSVPRIGRANVLRLTY
jgi:broad specificity phosphatase PhoE